MMSVDRIKVIQLNDSNKNMALVDHLAELRKRMITSIVLLVLGFALSYPFAKQIFGFLIKPLADIIGQELHRKLIYTGLAEAFITYVKISIFNGFIVAFPFIFSQLWAFIAPGLYNNEKKLFRIIFITSPVLFLLGACFAFYWIIPLAWKFFLSFESSAISTSLPIQLEAKVSEYFSMVLQMLIAFGICFQMPLVLLMLAKLNIITSTGLQNKRRYSIIGILILSAILTPPDVLSMMGLAIPLYLLYEVSIILIKIMVPSTNNSEIN